MYIQFGKAFTRHRVSHDVFYLHRGVTFTLLQIIILSATGKSSNYKNIKNKVLNFNVTLLMRLFCV